MERIEARGERRAKGSLEPILRAEVLEAQDGFNAFRFGANQSLGDMPDNKLIIHVHRLSNDPCQDRLIYTGNWRRYK